MARTTEVATRSLDLVARNIDLVSTLVDATSTSGGLLNLGIQIGEWLQHEKVNRHELKDCFESAYALAWPNRNGEIFRNEVRTKPAIKPLLPLFLQHSGSLGRLLVFDEALCWIVSTTGCLLKYHPEVWVTTIITTIIVDSRAKSQSSRPYPFEFGKVQVGAVVKKIVSSVWYNIVNAGTEPMDLPDALANICTVGHHLSPELLGRVIVALQQARPHMIIRSPLLYQNLALWLLLHFHGRFVVTVSGKIVFEENVGRISSQQQEIELRIASFCHSSTWQPLQQRRICSSSPQQTRIEVLENVAGNFEEFFVAPVPHHATLPQTEAQTRQELYSPKPIGKPGLLESSKIWTRCTAQEITRWILNLSVYAADDAEGYQFCVNIDDRASPKATGPSWKIADILKRMPGILNKKWGQRPPSIVVAEPIENASRDEGESDTLPTNPSESGREKKSWRQNKQLFPSFENLLPHFPILQELVNNVRGQCECTMCKVEITDDILFELKPIKPGCLQHVALSEVLILLSHAIADAFGVDNTSARRETDTLLGLMTLILLDLVEERSMLWSHWFCLAGTVLLGCPISDNPPGGATVCALQYGSLAAVAGWLDMNKQSKVPSSFSLIYGEGKLGTMNKDSNYNQFRGLVSEHAVVHTEEVEDTTSYNETHPKKPDRIWSEMHNLHDDSKAESDCILVSLGQEVYKLLTRVKSNTHSRIIDPAQVISQTAKGIPLLPNTSDCHKHSRCNKRVSLPKPIIAYSFDEVLGRWPETGSSNFFVSHILDTNLKLNVAYALCGDVWRGDATAISTSETPCVECIAGCHGNEKRGVRADRPMYIINTASSTPRLKRAVKTIPASSSSAGNQA